ncbi:hypothetical protein SAMN05216371_0037 [Streptomyces sp. TLI_053]|uniref:hypothetical protein n=1 Tax=Streptomyces sp. TLI_053 TaxID=1855352 RepID=UPI00087CD502|nr:hypothetical protein [Streptomyces sp. TLI_053]SDS49421.1 hypothetical protein SAMN05216371_0037 [Streptomyces sp. TLI_053]
MASESRPTAKGPARADWELTPLEGVGPLSFGALVPEVAAELPGMAELRRFQADPSFPETLGVEFGTEPEKPAVYAYFTDHRLFCVAVDAVHGPQVSLWGRELTSCVPGDLERFLLHAHRCGVIDVSYGPRGNPGANALGLVLRVQETPGGPGTRPVMVGRAWAERCTDDWEGAIPECEWVGRQWTYPGHSENWPAPGHAPSWGDWQPPF